MINIYNDQFKSKSEFTKSLNNFQAEVEKWKISGKAAPMHPIFDMDGCGNIPDYEYINKPSNWEQIEKEEKEKKAKEKAKKEAEDAAKKAQEDHEKLLINKCDPSHKDYDYLYARESGYHLIVDQLDNLFWDIHEGKLGVKAKTSKFYLNRKANKERFPKPDA